MQELQIVKVRGIRVLTSAQIAECYETTCDRIKQNFKENKGRFVEGKHYIALVGEELKKFKNEVGKCDLVRDRTENEVRISRSAEIKSRYQFDTQFKYAKCLYLWTEKGALLHAKSLNTDKAWEVYDYLVDFYFRAKGDQKVTTPVCVEKPAKTEKEPNQEPIDIAPPFRDLISRLPLEVLDEMEKVFRGGGNKAIRLATASILAEKMKRQLA